MISSEQCAWRIAGGRACRQQVCERRLVEVAENFSSSFNLAVRCWEAGIARWPNYFARRALYWRRAFAIALSGQRDCDIFMDEVDGILGEMIKSEK